MDDSDKIKIVCIGDSITGWNHTSSESKRWPFKTYPEFLEEKFQSKQDFRVANKGYEGDISFYAKEITEKALKKYPNAEYFIFLSGANDIDESIPEEKSASDVAKQVSANLESCIDLTIQNNKKPVLLSIPYAFIDAEWGSEHNLKVDECNARLKEYCSARRILFIDICSKLNQEHFADGLHPNEKGAEIIAHEVYKTITELKI